MKKAAYAFLVFCAMLGLALGGLMLGEDVGLWRAPDAVVMPLVAIVLGVSIILGVILGIGAIALAIAVLMERRASQSGPADDPLTDSLAVSAPVDDALVAAHNATLASALMDVGASVSVSTSHTHACDPGTPCH